MEVRKWTIDDLILYFKKQNVIINKIVPNPGKSILHSIIIGQCSTLGCDNTFTKKFTIIEDTNNTICRPCISKASRNKAKKTMLKRYNVDHVTKLKRSNNFYKNYTKEEIRRRRGITMKKKYGCEYLIQNKEYAKILAEKNKLNRDIDHYFSITEPYPCPAVRFM